jgi:hypothetical protein
VLSTVIAFGTIALGKLNVIAPIVSMFFLLSYGLLNYATYVEAHANSPSFRPRFRWFNERLSLAGCLACIGAMLAINPTAGAVAIAVLFALHQYIARNVDVERWAASERSRRLRRVREDLHALRERLDHPRDWRPVLLAFSDAAGRRERLLRFASWLEGGSGFTTAVRLVATEGPQARQERDRVEQELREEIKQLGLPAFARAIVATDFDDAVPVLLQAHGIGAVRPNTVLLNWFDRPPLDDEPAMREYGGHLRMALRFGCNVVILASEEQDFHVLDRVEPAERKIDVWYRDNATGELMLLLAYLMTRSEEFEDARIRLFVRAPKEKSREEAIEELEAKLRRVRIDAEPQLVEETDAKTIVEHSAASVVVFLPFRLNEGVPDSPFGGSLEDLAFGLPVAAFVLGCQDIDLDAEPEEGVHGEIARAVDDAEKSEKLARQADADAAKAAEESQELKRQLDEARATGALEEAKQLEKAAHEAEKEAERLRRRAAKTRAKAGTAAEEADSLTGRQPDEETDRETET